MRSSHILLPLLSIASSFSLVSSTPAERGIRIPEIPRPPPDSIAYTLFPEKFISNPFTRISHNIKHYASRIAKRRLSKRNSAPPPDLSSEVSLRTTAQNAIDTLLFGSYDPVRGTYGGGCSWWVDGVTMQGTADLDYWSGVNRNEAFFKNFIAINEPQRFIINQWNDDEGWYGLIAMRWFQMYGNGTYLTFASGVHADMSNSWDNKCGGGIYWQKYQRTLKSIITNELYFAVSVKLYTFTKTQGYLDDAQRTLDWLESVGIFNQSDGGIRDGVDISDCTLSGGEWTYNSGPIIGGLVDMANATGNSTYLDRAKTIAFNAVMKFGWTTGGVIVEPCDVAGCDPDAIAFKGVLISNLAYLYEVWPSPIIKRFINDNYLSVLSQAGNEQYQFDEIWTGPYRYSSARSQAGVITLMAAAYLVNTRS